MEKKFTIIQPIGGHAIDDTVSTDSQGRILIGIFHL